MIFTEAEFGLGEYHFFGLINPYIDLIEVNNCKISHNLSVISKAAAVL